MGFVEMLAGEQPNQIVIMMETADGELVAHTTEVTVVRRKAAAIVAA